MIYVYSNVISLTNIRKILNMSKLIKKINPNEYLKLSSYAEKYGICNRKLYRYINNDMVENIIIDGIPFIKDAHFYTLEHDNRETIVPNLTIGSPNVTSLTIDKEELTENQVDNTNVTNLTIDNSNVTNLTLQKTLNKLLEIPENERSIKEFEKIEEIRKKI